MAGPLDFFTVVDTQRALRRFRSDPVPDAAIRRVIAAAALALNFAAAPALIVCCLDPRQLGPLAGPDCSLRSPLAAYASIFPAVQNVLLAARALGLGATLTTLHRTFEPALRPSARAA